MPSRRTSGNRAADVAPPRRAGRLLLLLALALVQSGCLYSFRAGTGFPSYIRTVAVIPFENETTRFELTQEIHEQLLRELPRALGIRPGSEENADAVVRGVITSYNTTAPAFGAGAGGDRAQVALRQVSIMVAVEIIDLVENQILWDSRSVSGRGEFLDSEIEDVGRLEAIEALVQQIVDGAQSNW
jgi:hypothetical protein